MAFRLIAFEMPDLQTIRVVGRLRDEGVALLCDACDRARRPLVLDLSELTSASDAGLLALARLAGAGVHLLGASPYVRLLLQRVEDVPKPPPPGKRRPARPPRPGRRSGGA
jgi:hypothetical protein